MSSVVISGDTSGSITLAAPAVAGTNTLTLPANTGTVITTASSGQSIPKAALPTGSVLQVVSANTNTTTSNTSSTATAASNLSVSITPTSSTSKIFLIASVVATNSNGNGNYYFAKNGTTIGATEKYTASTGTTSQYAISMSYLDSPATTSATTYQVYFNAGSGTMYVNQNGTYSTITAMEIVA
jgi:hypothetical protein